MDGRGSPAAAPRHDPELATRLGRGGPFGGLRPDDLAQLAGRFERQRLAAGEALMRRGEAGDRLFLVLKGRLALIADGAADPAAPGAEAPADRAPVQEVGEGAWLGEITALAGGERTATVRALEDCEVASLAREPLLRALETRPEALSHFLDDVRARWRRIRFQAIARRLFDELDAAALEELADEVEWVALPGGGCLFRQDDPADAAFLVMSGRLRVVQEDGACPRLLNEVGRGETLGEMALLTRDRRSASVYAVRDSQLARLSQATFEKLIERHPSALRRIAGLLVERLRKREAGRESRRSLGTFCVLGLAGDPAETRDFARRLAAALSAHASTLHLDRPTLESRLGRSGIDSPHRDDPASIRLEHWLDEQEAEYRYRIYEAEPRWSSWTERAARLADHLVLVAPLGADPRPGELEQRLARCLDAAPAPQTTLVLLRDAAEEPQGAGRWLAGRRVDQHFHARRGERRDLERVARMLTGRGVGLVLGGGGARGFAHVGVLRALEELDLPVDAVGGTSMGAIIAAGRALEWSWQEVLERLRRHLGSLYDPTLPMLSLLAGRRIGRQLAAAFGEREIEDLLLPFFCVSTNISRADERIHRRGRVAAALRASISLPGILPPVQDSGDLLVDGGVVNNLPADVMGRLWGCGRMVAVDVSPEADFEAIEPTPPEVSGWSLLWRRLNPFGQRAEVPHIATILMRSSVIPSMISQRRREGLAKGDLELRIPTGEWRLLDFAAMEPISRRGYESALEPLRRWWSEGPGAAPDRERPAGAASGGASRG